MKPTIDKLKFVKVVDEFPDLSYLEYDETFTDEHNASNEERLKQFHNGDVWMLGMWVEATVSYPTNERGDRRIETLRSGGLWGIECDSDEDYINGTILADELADLKEHLEAFGVDTTNLMEIEVEED